MILNDNLNHIEQFSVPCNVFRSVRSMFLCYNSRSKCWI